MSKETRQGQEDIDVMQGLPLGTEPHVTPFYRDPVCLSVVICFLLLSAAWFFLDNSWPFWDAADHVRVEFEYGELLRHIRPFKMEWWHQFLSVNYCYPPTVHIINGVLKAVFGSGRWVDGLSLLSFGVLMNMSIYGLALLLFRSRLQAVFSVCILNFYPMVSSLSHLKLLDFPHLSLFCLAMYALHRWWQRPVPANAWFSGLCMALDCTAKQVASFYMFMPGVVLLLWAISRRDWLRVRHLFVMAACVLVGLLIWVVPNWADIQAYMHRNSGIIARGGPGQSFLPNLIGYGVLLPEMLSLPLLFAFALATVFAGKDSWLKTSMLWIGGISGTLCMCLLSFQLPEGRYIVPLLVAAALLSAAGLANMWQSPRPGRRLAAGILLLAGLGQFILRNFSPYPLAVPQSVEKFFLVERPDIRVIGPCDSPTPPGDVWGQKWVIETVRKDAAGAVWLNVLPSTPEISPHTLSLVARYARAPISVSTSRVWTPKGDHVEFSVSQLKNFPYVLLKSGNQGNHLDGQQSEKNWRQLESFVRMPENYTLLGKYRLADSSELELYRLRLP